MKKLTMTILLAGCICLLSTSYAKEIKSFWTSPEQRADVDYNWKKGAYFKRIDGKIIRFTEATPRGQKPSGRCRYKYLGDGVVLSVGGVIQ